MISGLPLFPHDVDTEMALLAQVFTYRHAVQGQTRIGLTADLFHLPQHRQLFEAICQIPCDVPEGILAAVEYLRSHELFPFTQHPGLAGDLSRMIPMEEFTEYYAAKLADLRQQREIKRLGKKLEDDSHTHEVRTRLIELLENFGKEDTLVLREPRIRFYRPSELRDYQPDADVVLAGTCHVMRGEVFVIGGEPGVGKSTAATELAICGATGQDWLGLPVHCRFKTMIVQNENGRFRLRDEYLARGLDEDIEDHILVSEPPPFGMTLNHPEFLADVRMALRDFEPDVVIFDPWNAAAKDDKAADYSAAFDALRSMLPTGKKKPALGIVAHTKKPQNAEKRTGGSGLMHLLSGSYVLASVPRAIFIMVRGSTDETDSSVVWFNPKNSNGPSAGRTAWSRSPAGFQSLSAFDWNAFDEGENGRRSISLDQIEEVLGTAQVRRSYAVKMLAELAGVTDRCSRDALSPDGKFAEYLDFFDDLVALKN